MFFSRDEVEIKKLVSFYSVYTSAYFSLLILILYWTNGIYAAGKYKFNAVILFIIVSEVFKYFASHLYFKAHDVNLSKKYDSKSKSTFMRSVFSKPRLREGFKNATVVFFMILVYFVIAILYGAEVFSKHEETFMFSSLLSVLTIFPACLNLGSQSVASLVLGSKPINKLETLLYQNLYLTVLGAWLGAFVIPLDWDRPWQVWPIPCSLGAMIGFVVSHVVMMVKEKVVFKKKNKRLA